MGALIVWLAMLAGQLSNPMAREGKPIPNLPLSGDTRYRDGIYRCVDQVCTYVAPLDNTAEYIASLHFQRAPQPESLDVPLEEKWDPPLPTILSSSSSRACFGDGDSDSMCLDGVVYKRRYVCSDSTRFKLKSEDGKWHCLKLTN